MGDKRARILSTDGIVKQNSKGKKDAIFLEKDGMFMYQTDIQSKQPM